MSLVSTKRLFEKLVKVVDEELRKVLMSLNEEERKVFEYFLQYISVGDIIAIRELRALYRVQDPKSVIRSLINKGLLEAGLGTYSLSQRIREALLHLVRSKAI